MTNTGRLLSCIAITTALLATPAVAGTPVKGYGDSKLAAMEQANARVHAEAAKRQTCVSEYATPSTCVEENGVWACHAIVADRHGSCNNRR